MRPPWASYAWNYLRLDLCGSFMQQLRYFVAYF